MTFALDGRLQAGTETLGRFPLSLVLLSRNAHFPWCLLVPMRPGLSEIHQLSREDQHQLIDESSRLARGMELLFSPDSMNVAALGNVVAQLHLHHVARFRADAAWPGPVWGAPIEKRPYEPAELQARVESLKKALAGPGFSALSGWP